MKIAAVKTSPTFAGKLVSVDDKAARAMPGVVDVIRIGDAVAVVGDHYWAAKQGLEALDIQWDRGVNANLTTQQLRDALAESALNGASIVARKSANVRPAALRSMRYTNCRCWPTPPWSRSTRRSR